MTESLTTLQSKLDKLAMALAHKCHEFASILLFAPRQACNGDFITKTDGKIIKVGRKFFELEFNEQLYKILHIACHVALRHHHRARELRGNPNGMKIWNISTDIIINQFILPYLNSKFNIQRNPNTQIKLEDISELIDFQGLDINNLSADQIFLTILKSIDNKELDPNDLPDVDNDLSGDEFSDSNNVLDGYGLENEKKPANSRLNDMLWNQRLEKAIKQAGKAGGNSLMGLLNHLAKPKVPWDKLLRQYLISRLSQEKEPNYRRPSRRNLAGITNYFEPSRQNKKTIKTLVVCMDLSGSCWCSEVVSKFVSNIDMVKDHCRNKVVLITFDYGINDIIEVPVNKKLADIINNKEVKLHGGGGTEFSQPIEKAKEYNPDVCVVFTDCYGDFGEQPKFPVVWASIGDTAPWGHNIKIED